ncbi:hypothetical protein FIBSPDRAFT_962499 [Athelia psychrophila]|uniref:Uncharacterized protein n=1 Tax=Athelia psychrophila TaxID=1759441 RepID=A0A166A294_9AGAM|nr:hypothetical protein FIBSPDRAFT_962499 [Fibularhizoctonia sp. CBS 109695]
MTTIESFHKLYSLSNPPTSIMRHRLRHQRLCESESQASGDYLGSKPLLYASQNNLYALAIAASAHLRAVYLKKLFSMHMGRVDALKGLLFPPPYPHAHEGKWEGCSAEDRVGVSRAWSLAAISLAEDVDDHADVQEQLCAAFHPVADPPRMRTMHWRGGRAR